MLSDVIRQRRADLGLSTRRVCELAHLTDARLAELEGGHPPMLHEVTALSQALVLDAGAVLRGEAPCDVQRSAARFRAPAGVAEVPPETARMLAVAAELARAGMHLWALLDRGPVRLAEIRRVMSIATDRDAWLHGYELGEAARLTLSGDPQPCRDLEQHLEAWGVHVAHIPMADPSIHAVSLCEPDALPVILLNENASRVSRPLSRRAILAHELCHLLHDGGEQSILTMVSRHGARDAAEQRANAFAPGFLAPRSWTRQRLAPGLTDVDVVHSIADDWGFTFEGAAYHAKNANLLPAARANELAQASPTQIDETGWEPAPRRTPLPRAFAQSPPSALVRGLIQDLIVEAFERDHISRGRTKELLAFS